MNKYTVAGLVVLSMVICCTAQTLDPKLKTLTLSQTKKDNNLVLVCDLSLEKNQDLAGVYMRYKDQWYYGVNIGNMRERYRPEIIASDRLIDRTPPLYDRTSKYGRIRNVITGATESDDYDCWVTFSVSGITFYQSSREVITDRRFVKTAIYDNNVLSSRYRIGDNVSIHCDYQMQNKDIFRDITVSKDGNQFFRYLSHNNVKFTPQKGVENIQMDADNNKQLYLTINPVDKANVNTGGQYECKVNFINPDDVEDHIETQQSLNRISF
ncbi:unnamed protein product [Medioppia subpectinata]|uniref:Uncharacterized protein n=1 Tax=Medioppia subpectinata TaxID=1979941 RepID=A0A7R9Q338_9ACAR|nr:unnamed protein product [Medioppia subpectinata]CAG2110058.1 unnamed protein product [Medioppia subpectinata]